MFSATSLPRHSFSSLGFIIFRNAFVPLAPRTMSADHWTTNAPSVRADLGAGAAVVVKPWAPNH